jgi:hypothetical protein
MRLRARCGRWTGVAAGVLLAACAGSARAQSAGTDTAALATRHAAAGSPVRGGCVWGDSAQQAAAVADADVAIVAHVHAQSVRVSEARGTGVSFPLAAPGDSTACVVRSTLPHPLQRGRTYHDVDIDLRITTRLDTTRVARPDSTARARPPAAAPSATPPNAPGSNR